MKFNPDIHRRQSIRRKGHDYSEAGLYFVTCCVQSRLCLFGEIVDNEMVLNSAGKMIDRWWNKLAYKFQNVQLNEYVVMPNHFHGILEIKNRNHQNKEGEHIGSPLREISLTPVGGVNPQRQGAHDQDKAGAHAGAPLPQHPEVSERRGRPACLPNSSYAPLPQHRVVPDRWDESEKPERTHQINTGRTHGSAPTVGVDPRVYPDSPYAPLREISLTPVGGVNPQILGAHTGAPLHVGVDPRVYPDSPYARLPSQSYEHQTWAHTWVRPYDTGKPAPLHKMIQWFKTMTTNEYIRNERQNGWTPFDKKLWQRNYYEHIIRDDESSQEIREYIINNPINWKDDTLFPESTNNQGGHIK